MWAAVGVKFFGGQVWQDDSWAMIGEILKKLMDSSKSGQGKLKGLGNGSDRSAGEGWRIHGQFYVCVTGRAGLSSRLGNTKRGFGYVKFACNWGIRMGTERGELKIWM